MLRPVLLVPLDVELDEPDPAVPVTCIPSTSERAASSVGCIEMLELKSAMTNWSTGNGLRLDVT